MAFCLVSRDIWGYLRAVLEAQFLEAFRLVLQLCAGSLEQFRGVFEPVLRDLKGGDIYGTFLGYFGQFWETV